jgi:hypothetical protein
MINRPHFSHCWFERNHHIQLYVYIYHIHISIYIYIYIPIIFLYLHQMLVLSQYATATQGRATLLNSVWSHILQVVEVGGYAWPL